MTGSGFWGYKVGLCWALLNIDKEFLKWLYLLALWPTVLESSVIPHVYQYVVLSLYNLAILWCKIISQKDLTAFICWLMKLSTFSCPIFSWVIFFFPYWFVAYICKLWSLLLSLIYLLWISFSTFWVAFSPSKWYFLRNRFFQCNTHYLFFYKSLFCLTNHYTRSRRYAPILFF